MVVVAFPPPSRRPDPVHQVLPPGSRLLRIFDPTSHSATALTFRQYGPLHRFDHHEGRGPDFAPSLSATRGILYAGLTLSCCVVEVFGDGPSIQPDGLYVADLLTTRALHFLDLRGSGAMRAGTVAALSKIADRRCSQAWGRYFYDCPADYGEVDGIWFYNAHNEEDALAVYERAADGLAFGPLGAVRLDDPGLRPLLLDIARRHGLYVR